MTTLNGFSPIFVVRIITKLKVLIKFDFLMSTCNWGGPDVELKPLITIFDVYFSSSVLAFWSYGSFYIFFPKEKNYKKINYLIVIDSEYQYH